MLVLPLLVTTMSKLTVSPILAVAAEVRVLVTETFGLLMVTLAVAGPAVASPLALTLFVAAPELHAPLATRVTLILTVPPAAMGPMLLQPREPGVLVLGASVADW